MFPLDHEFAVELTLSVSTHQPMLYYVGHDDIGNWPGLINPNITFTANERVSYIDDDDVDDDAEFYYYYY